jgi:hypothetical protein
MTGMKPVAAIVNMSAIGVLGFGTALGLEVGPEPKPDGRPAGKKAVPDATPDEGRRPAHVIHRIEQRETDKYSGAAVVVENPPVVQKPTWEQVKVLEAHFNAAVVASQEGKANVKAGSNLNVVAIGRMLFPPDRVAVRGLVRRKGRLELEVVYTHDPSYRFYTSEDMKHPWHPMIQLPVDLPPGPYELAVTWRQVAAVPDGKSLDQYCVHTFEFTVVK